MQDRSNPTLPSDVCLLLRADAEQCWLHREVIPVLRQVETGERLAEEEVGPALAYLEAMWDEARVRARATDAARASLHAGGGEDDLRGRAGHYHAAVRTLREVVAARVAPLVRRLAADGEDGLLSGEPQVDGCAPRAA